MNENQYALKIISDGIVGDKPSETLSILARYFRHENGLKDKEIFSKLNAHMLDNYPNYNPVKWSITLDKQVHKSKKYSLVEIDHVPITQAELDTISQINNIRLERVAFTLLCFTKYSNLKNSNNNNWANREHKEIFKIARVVVPAKRQCQMLFELKERGLIGIGKKVNNINIRIQFVDSAEAKAVLKIIDFRELGYEYMLYRGGNYVRCGECGVLIKPKNNKTKYCRDCAVDVAREKHKVRQQSYRQRDLNV